MKGGPSRLPRDRAGPMLVLAEANLKEAASSLLAAPQRTVLALIGIAIGVGSVVAMISVGVIVKGEALKNFQELGTDILTIYLEQDDSPRGSSLVTPDDVLGLAAVPAIAEAAPYMVSFGQITLAGRAVEDVSIVGVTATFAGLNKLGVEAGRHISDLDYRRYFCVIGAELAAAMRRAGAERIVGETVTVDRTGYTVVGVLRRTPPGMRRFQPDRAVIIPVSTAQRVFDRPEVRTVTARMSAGFHHVAATREVGDYFRRKSADLAVRVESAEELIEQMSKQTRLFALLLGSVGGISLLVGGIGVMNIMLVSVTERRLEIGIRRALGARRADIQSQFLMESVMLSLTGGIVGIGVGIGATWGICQYSGWELQVSLLAVGLGVGVASVTGMFFGFYPAYQAARLDPVAALRGT